MKKGPIFVIVCMGLLMSCAQQPVASPLPPAPNKPELPAPFTPAQSEACQKQGGTMQAGGMLGNFSCVIPYKDAGKACHDKSDCQGKCLTHDFGRAQTETAVVGQCQATNSPFGCYAEVRDGKIGPALCVD